MNALMVVFAVLGGVALAFRVAASLLRLLLSTGDALATRGIAEVSARRGDLTAMEERRAAAARAGRRRRGDALVFLAWFLLLSLPVLTGTVRWVYPIAALLWILPRRTVRPDVR